MYDVAIIGNGLVGLGAAMYAGRFELKTLLIGELLGGTITQTDKVENYPGFVSITSQELVENFRKHAEAYSIDHKYGRVDNIIKEDDHFKIFSGENNFESKTVILATGTIVRRLGVESEKIYENKGVSYCALCDGAFFKDKVVAVVGGGDGAAVDALILTRYAKKVYLIVRKDKMRAEPTNQQKLIENDKIEIIYNTNVLEFKGENMLQKIKLDNPFKGNEEIEVQGCFIAIGHIINSELAKQLGVNLNDKGEIIIDRKAKTNVKGVYAAGDVVDTHFKQAITGVAEGVFAAHSAYEEVSR